MKDEIKIFIIESLSDCDKKTGTNLYNELIQYHLPITSKLYDDIYNENDWNAAINNIIDNVCVGDLVFVHLEIHGNKGTGITLKNDSVISFQKLCSDFRQINKKIGCNLYITLAVCHGLFLLFGSMPLEQMPFCGVIGSKEEIGVWDIEIRFYEFYQSLIDDNGIDYSFELLKEANPDIPNSYEYVKLDEIFHNAWRNFMRESSGEAWQKQNAIRVSKDSALNRRERRKFGREFKRKRIKYAKSLFREKVKEFYMLEDFPQNRDKFYIPQSPTVLL